MWRKSLPLTALLAVLAVCATQTAQAAAQNQPLAGAQVRSVPTLGRCLDAETIKAALKTATPEEDGFVQHVVDRVNAGKLPRDLVVTTFLWARKKPRQQFQYFRFGLIVRAGWLGISL
jgi:phage-related protein